MFDLWKQVFEVLHYIIALSPIIILFYVFYNNIIRYIFSIYLFLIFWVLICILFQGCPLTILENYISCKYFGKYFYPNYEFSNSLVYHLIKRIEFYVPLLMGIVFLISNNYGKSSISIKRT